MTDKLTEEDLRTRRLKSCVENWPEAEDGEYNPSCCRFPKSCSPHGYIEAVKAGNLRDEDLEVKPTYIQPDEPEQPPAHVHQMQCPVRVQHGSHLIEIGPYGGEIHYMRCIGKNGRDLDQRVF